MNIRHIEPRNFGWLQCQMSDDIVQHIWDCCDKEHNYKYNLAGHIESSYLLKDKDDYLWNNCISQLVTAYGNEWGHGWGQVPTHEDVQLETYLHSFWINYQNATEYNPIHSHGGLYSFAGWLKIPTTVEEQAKHYTAKGANNNFNGCFCFEYTNIFGQLSTYTYKPEKAWENTILLFPSILRHIVYPYYDESENRISISGNVALRLKE